MSKIIPQTGMNMSNILPHNENQVNNETQNFGTVSHSFNVEIASKYGIDEAILIHHIAYWISYNQRLGKNFHEGYTWMSQTYEEMAAHFPYWTKEKVRDIIYHLETGKTRKSTSDELDFEPVLISRKFNTNHFDHTKWYTFKIKNMFTKGRPPKREFPGSQLSSGSHPSPTLYTDTKDTMFVADEPVGSPLSSIEIEGKDGKIALDETALYKKLVATRSLYSQQEILYAWETLENYRGIVYDWWNFLKGTIEKYRKSKKSKWASSHSSGSPKDSNIRKDICNNTLQHKSKKCKSECLEKDIEERPSLKLVCLGDLLNEH